MKWNVKEFRSIIGVCILVLIVINAQAQTSKKRLLVFDRQVPNYQTLANQKNDSVKVLILPEIGNPLDYITNALKKIIIDEMRTVDEIHIYAITKPGTILFDKLTLGTGNVHDYQLAFDAWKNLLNPGAVIVIHSGSLTTIPEGAQLVNSIKELTGAEVKVLE